MKSNWNTIKMGLMLLALPLVATAAATAHQLMVDSKPLTLDLEMPVMAESSIGLARAHTVALNRNGAVEGQIATIGNGSTSGISDLKIYFVQNGKVVQETQTDKNGSFVAADISEGAYSFVATGENGFAAYGVRVVSDDSGRYDNLMEAAAVSPRFATVKRILNDKLPKHVANQIISTKISDANVVGSNRVVLKEGQLQGSVVALLGDAASVDGTYVHIIQNDRQVAEVQADETGAFRVSDLEPGVYDFVAAGPNGFAAVSFEAVQDPVLSDTNEVPDSVESGTVATDAISYQDGIPVNIPYEAGYSNSLYVCMTCNQDAGFISDQVHSDGMAYDTPIEYASEAIGCGGAAGGCCGSASNFSDFSACNSCGGGGLGRLLLIGGLVVAVTVPNDDPPESNSPSDP